MDLDTPAKRLRWARENRTNYSTGSDAARAFGWTVSTYLGHENGDRQPSVKAAKRYAAAYKVPWTWILEGGRLDQPTPSGDQTGEVVVAFSGHGQRKPPSPDNQPTPPDKTQRAFITYSGADLPKMLLDLLGKVPPGSDAEDDVVDMLRRLKKSGDDK